MCVIWPVVMWHLILDSFDEESEDEITTNVDHSVKDSFDRSVLA